MMLQLSLALLVTFVGHTLAAEDTWLSPEYKEFYKHKLPIPPTKSPKTSYKNETTGQVIDYYEIEVKEFEQQIYSGLKPAKLIGYDGMSPGPTFRVEKGRETVVRFINRSPNDFSVHLHGSYSRAPFDGWAEDVTKPGQYKDYYYPNKQSARTLWYHDHAVGQTAENAYFGQAGFYLLHDAAEDALNLPSGDYDVPLALSSKQYNQDGTLFDPKDERDSLFGDVIHVNGQPWPYFEVEPRKYRLRFLDTSISRGFKLYFDDEATGKKIPFQVIAADAGLMTRPVESDELEIAMAERWEVVMDFGNFAGKNITLRNSRRVQVDEDYHSTDQVMQFVVGKNVASQQGNGDLPSSLREVPFPSNANGVDRSFRFERRRGVWEVNGVTFSDVNNRILAKPKRGQTEIWEFSTGRGWSHPVHVHLVDFQVLSRNGGRGNVLPYEKEALKDVVLLGASETVRVIARFAPWDGVYMFHCHNLIHEDHDMMAAFNVTSLGDWGYSEKTSFIDPMDEKYRSKDIDQADFDESAIQERLNEYYLLDAYKDPEKVEAALESFWNAGGPSQVPKSAPNTVMSATVSASISASSTSTPTLLESGKGDDSRPNTLT